MYHFFNYNRSFSGEEEKSTAQIRAEIDSHLEGKTRVESSLPQSITIGPFFINTDAVRLALAKKHKDIAKALLNFLVDKLRKDTEKVSVKLWWRTNAQCTRSSYMQCTYVCVLFSYDLYPF